MPLNESRGQPRSTLTREQKEEAMRALYGLPREEEMSEFSAQEIEIMRQKVAAHDAQHRQIGVREFDLNRPPKEPYVYQEFPRMLYHHGEQKTKIVYSPEECEAYQAQGWSKDQCPVDFVEPELDAATAREAAVLDEQLAEGRRKPGRPRREE